MSKELDKFLNRNIDEIIEWQGIITDMIEEPEKYGYADDTLRGILDMMDETGAISDGQKRAVENIRRKPSRNYGRRRY